MRTRGLQEIYSQENSKYLNEERPQFTTGSTPHASFDIYQQAAMSRIRATTQAVTADMGNRDAYRVSARRILLRS